MSGRLRYRTIAALVMTLGVNNLPLMLGVVLLPFQLALLDWYRKAELSGDRLGERRRHQQRAQRGKIGREIAGIGVSIVGEQVQHRPPDQQLARDRTRRDERRREDEEHRAAPGRHDEPDGQPDGSQSRPAAPQPDHVISEDATACR